MRWIAGRDGELSKLDAVVEGALAGRPGLALVHGEPGIGKTTLVEVAAERAAARGLQIAWGRAWDLGGTPAFWPWIQTLRAVREHGEALGPELARLLPELGRVAASTDSIDDRFAMFDGVLRALTASADPPLLVVLEDLHAADLGSLELLAFIAAHVRACRLAIIGTYRSDQVRGELVDRIAHNANVIGLGPLDRDAAETLIRRTSAVAVDAERLYAASAGNPLYLVEMLHMLEASPSRALLIPDGARRVIRERLANLAADRRDLLEVAAALAGDIDVPLLAAACGRSVAETSAALVESGDLLVARDGGRFAFRHALFKEALYRELPPARRAEHHARIAGSLEALHADDPTAPQAAIAHHLLEAGPDHGERAVVRARAAAAQALRQLAFESAATLLDRALATGGHDPRRRSELLVELAHARILAGDRDGARDACLRAAELARALHAPDLLARAALGYGAALTIGRNDLTLLDLLDEALQALPDTDAPLRALLLARLAAARQPSLNPAEPMAIARRAIEMVQRVGDDRTRLDVLHMASASLVKFGPPPERVAIDRETRTLALRLGDRSLALRADARLVVDHVECGELRAALQHVESYEQQVAGILRPNLRWPAPMFRAMLALYEGRFDEHRAYVDEARAWIAPDDHFAARSLELHEIGVLRARGDDAALAGRSSQLWHEMREGNELYERTIRWMIAARNDRASELAHDLRRCDPRAFVVVGDPVLAIWASEAVALARDVRWAEALYAWLSTIPSRVALQGLHGCFIEGPITRVLYLLADVLDRDEARDHFTAALDHARAHHARPLESRVLFEWGSICNARGDIGPARDAWREAHALASELDIPFAARIAASLGDAVPEATALTLVREGEFWTLSGHGATVRLRHGRGVEFLARMLGEPGRQLSALDLAGHDEVDVGDAGEHIDHEAVTAYRTRLQELEAELARAEEWHDSGRAARLADEREAIMAELSRGLGLGGRHRRAASSAERARINVQRRLAGTLRQIQSSHAGLGKHLASCVRTGNYCSYDPARDPGTPRSR